VQTIINLKDLFETKKLKGPTDAFNIVCTNNML
jgi:hypothetical protein